MGAIRSWTTRCVPIVLVAGAVATFAGCDFGAGSGNGPFWQPGPLNLPTTPAAPAEPTADISGAWSGTATVTWDAIDGGGGCTEPMTAAVTQSGTVLAGTVLDTPEVVCLVGEPATLSASIDGNVLRGTLAYPETTLTVSGTISERRWSLASYNVVWEFVR